MVTTAGHLILVTFFVSLAGVTCCWLFGLFDGNNISGIDGYYGFATALHGVLTFILWHHHTARGAVLTVVTASWSVALGQSMGRRWWRERPHGGDARYRDTAARLHLDGRGFWWKTWPTMVAPQAGLILLLNLPLQWAIMTDAAGFTALDVIGILVTAGAGTLEAVANRQLEIYKRGPRVPGSTLMTGVWAWSRHPNYFGNVMVYAGCYLVALRDAGLWWTVISPVTALFVLRFILGVRMTDQRMLEKRKDDPQYLDYVARTPSFLPRPPRRRPTSVPAVREVVRRP
jgi:steroid 5-alpha reductase family enzyme